MHKIFLPTLTALGLCLSSATFAQDTTTQNDQPEANATTETTEVETKEDETFPVAENPEDQIGSETIVEEHGDWKIVCVNAGNDQKPICRLYQLLVDQSKNPVSEMSIVSLQSASKAIAGVNFVSPLGTLLSGQVSMRVDSGNVKRYPFSWCEPKGCVTRFGLTAVEIENLKKGSKAVMTIVAVASPKTPLALNLSLDGFTAAWNALAVINAK